MKYTIPYQPPQLESQGLEQFQLEDH
jgi:hypothetical protein